VGDVKGAEGKEREEEKKSEIKAGARKRPPGLDEFAMLRKSQRLRATVIPSLV
jgi:hypothetical protein